VLRWRCSDCEEELIHADAGALAALVQDHAETHGRVIARNQLIARFRRERRYA
jgi:hypothetical protein